MNNTTFFNVNSKQKVFFKKFFAPKINFILFYFFYLTLDKLFHLLIIISKVYFSVKEVGIMMGKLKIKWTP